MSSIDIQLNEFNNKSVIEISGSKNSSLPIIAASILCDEVLYINNIPKITDVKRMLDILKYLKIKYIFQNNTLKIYPKKHIKWNIQTKSTNELRGSYYFLGSLISKKSKVKLYNIGGCSIGKRPINYHLNSFQTMGLKINSKEHETKISGHIKSTIINLDYPSVGATINIILASVKNKSTTNIIINNASIEPEVVDLCNFLISMGASIQGVGSNNISINSVKHLHSTNYTIISDRIEAGTFLILGALHNGIILKNVNTNHLDSLITILKNIGCTLEEKDNLLYLYSNKQKSFSITTQAYPEFPTDLAPQISVLATQLNGFSTITETVYKDRFSHISELRKLNLEIIQNQSTTYIRGKQKTKNSNTPLICKDLRQGAALILASSLSNEKTHIQNTSYIDRGYEDLYDKLSKLGFVIKTYD